MRATLLPRSSVARIADASTVRACRTVTVAVAALRRALKHGAAALEALRKRVFNWEARANSCDGTSSPHGTNGRCTATQAEMWCVALLCSPDVLCVALRLFNVCAAFGTSPAAQQEKHHTAQARFELEIRAMAAHDDEAVS